MCRLKSKHKIDFTWHLIRAAEMVGIILGEAAHAHQPVHHAAAFIAVYRTFFCIAKGQIAV